MFITARQKMVNSIDPLVWGRRIWLLLYATIWLMLLFSIVPRYQELLQPFAGERFDFLRATTENLDALGMSPAGFALFGMLSEALYAGSFLIIAGIIYWKVPDEPFPLLAVTATLCISITSTYLLDVLAAEHLFINILANTIQAIGVAGLPLVFYLFPNGKFAPNWIRYNAIIWVTLTCLWLLFPNLIGNHLHEETAWRTPVFTFSLTAWALGSGAIAQIYRYFRVSTGIERRQTKWVVLGLVLFYLGVGVRFFVAAFLPNISPLPMLIITYLGSYITIVFPVTLALALLRYRLWDIDIIISRAVVFSALTAVLTGVYAGILLLGQRLLSDSTLFVNAVATIFVAILFQPLRDKLRQLVQRYLFGERHNPMGILSQLGERLEGVLSPTEVLPVIVTTLVDSLRLPYAGISLFTNGDHTIVTEQGKQVTDIRHIPLAYQGETMGQLLVAPRTQADPFSPEDERILDSFAQQAGTAIHALQLTFDLQRSRQRLVTAREEERRRLRRDLHDGLGPTLAAQVFRIGAARQLLQYNPAKADELLSDLETGLEDTLADIRRLVYGLRPPALDQLGLVGSIRDFVRQYEQAFAVVLEMPASLPHINAATEVAAFRIVQTALDNVAQHAHASHCYVTLTATDQLQITVRDNGNGLPTGYKAGVGLTSMRERAEELGGKLIIESGENAGTKIQAILPLNT